MNTPWKVVGFETMTNERGDVCHRLYLARPLTPEEGHTGEGLEVQREYINTRYTQYNPAVADLIIYTKNNGYVRDLWVVGKDR